MAELLRARLRVRRPRSDRVLFVALVALAGLAFALVVELFSFADDRGPVFWMVIGLPAVLSLAALFAAWRLLWRGSRDRRFTTLV